MSNFTIDPYTPFPAAAAGGFYVGSATVAADTSGGGSQVITITWSDGGSGRTVQWFEIDTSLAVTADTPVDHTSMSRGASDGTANWVMGNYAKDGQTQSTGGHAKHYSSDANCLMLFDDESTVGALATCSSVGSDQITLTWSNYPTTASRIVVRAYAGADEFYVGPFDPATADTGTASYTGFSAPANYVYGVQNYTSPWLETIATEYDDNVGYYSYDGSTARQRYHASHHRSLQSSSQRTQIWNSGAFMGESNRQAVQSQYVTLSSHANGFTGTTTGTLNDFEIGVCAAVLPAGQECYVADFVLPTSTGDDVVTTTGVSWTAQSIACSSHLSDNVSNDDITGNDDADGSCTGQQVGTATEACINVRVQDAVGTSDTGCETDDLLINLSYGASTEAAKATLSSFGAGQFTVNHSVVYTAGPGPGRCIYCIFEEV